MKLSRTVMLVSIALALTMVLAISSHPRLANAAATLPSGFVEELVVGGLESTPTAMEFAPDGRLFVAEDWGKLRIIDTQDALLPTPFLTVNTTTTGERGLLGIAFDPAYDINAAGDDYVYVYYTNPNPLQNRVSRFTTDPMNPDQALLNSELVILDGIPSEHNNHNGGAIHFGADGNLYIAVGDNFNSANSQSLSTLSGKMLRINTSACTNVCGDIIPDNPDNPFEGTLGAKKEIWAWGLRNPFTFGVDPVDGRIYINDVGRKRWEEVNAGASGTNYGWSICEGKCKPPDPTLEDPIYVYPNKGGAAITGGAFYRGGQFPSEYIGDYFFADYLQGFIRRLTPNNNAIDFANGASSPVDVKVGSDGSLYYLSLFEGAVYRIKHTGVVSGGSIHVGDISLSAKQKGPLWDVSSQITILDELDVPVGDVAVTVELSGDLNSTEMATTDGAGAAQFSTGRVLQSGESVTITVLDIALSGFEYDAASNVETSDQITIGP